MSPKAARSQNAQTTTWVLSVTVAVLAGIAGYHFLKSEALQTSPNLDYSGRTDYILRTTPLLDSHNDLPYLLRVELQNRLYNGAFDFRQALPSHTDLQRLKQGKVGAQFWSVFVECPDLMKPDDATHSVRDTLEQIDVTRRFIEMIDELEFCDTSACVSAAFSSGKIASMLGAEGLHQVGSSIAVIRQLFDLGVRYITITHNCDNPFATAASTVTAGGEDLGLSEFGVAGIREMNRLGMMVDLSHTSHGTMHQVLDTTQSPVIFSHSTCFELARTYRNTPDDVLVRLRQNGGVLMVMFVKRFLNAENPEAADIETVVDHIMHVVDVAGWDHVGIGGDFDGTVTLANGISSVADYPKLIAAVMKRGATDEQIRKLISSNFLRVWAENEKVAARLSHEMLPVEDVWEGRVFTRWNNPLPVLIPNNPNRVAALDYP
ncbi:putative dipeptidase [Colletotrichum eremochloae]|nr:putative dipeptidase [Colletotrichum eremochloae]